jgi:hypothetical protein
MLPDGVNVVIIWFQIFLNPLPVPFATVAVVVLCEVMLARPYAISYAGVFGKALLRSRHRRFPAPSLFWTKVAPAQAGRRLPFTTLWRVP